MAFDPAGYSPLGPALRRHDEKAGWWLRLDEDVTVQWVYSVPAPTERGFRAVGTATRMSYAYKSPAGQLVPEVWRSQVFSEGTWDETVGHGDVGTAKAWVEEWMIEAELLASDT